MKQIKKYRWWLVGLMSFVGMVLALVYPLPYYIEMPGGAYDIREVLRVDNKEDEQKGSYNFVAVTVSQATAAQLLYAWLTPFTDISSAEETTGGASSEDYERINQFYMETSQNMAIYQAMKLAGKETSLEFKGVYVLELNPKSTFKDVLHLADTVTGVNGKTFKSSTELIDYVAGLKIGDKVSVQYTSLGEEKTATGKIIKLDNGKNGIGIGLVDHTEVKSDIPIEFETDGVGGPSAGLMFTLDIYTQITNKDLRQGRVIAGTGTIEEDGTVGDVGGVDKKVVSAANSGAEIFFVPNNPVDEAVKKEDPDALTNYEEAKKAAKEIGTDMKIVPVKTAQDAIDYLEK
ncbi:SepM family pheromone-processing serine protease [Streptococcus sp. SGI.013]|uniref:SepM family pheromone-processing serine protease n=1 Tax=unclassified Streptococcus TaxID=2608887 RepID=UPI003CFC75A2